MKNQKFLALGLGLLASCPLFASQNEAGTAIPKEMLKKAEETIKRCEAQYQAVKVAGQTLDTIQKPGFTSSSQAKKAYQNRELYKKAFAQQFAQFAHFTNDKVKIRRAKSIEKLQDEVAAYSSNCIRFADGLSKFPEWVKTGVDSGGYGKVFEMWVKNAK